jgi:hypothetical protein
MRAGRKNPKAAGMGKLQIYDESLLRARLRERR